MQTVIFDMAGVVLKEGAVIPFSLIPFVKEQVSYETLIERYQLAKVGEISDADFWKGVSDWKETENKFLDSLEINNDFHMLKKLKPKYKLSLLSNFVGSWADYLIEKYDFNSLFDSIVISANCKMKKPDSKIYKYALSQLNAKAEETFFVDDQKRNLMAAHKLGMKTVFFKTERDKWFNSEINFKADLEAKSLTEVAECLMKET
ncbi:MAG: HAD-IA family hydrolase [Candidatus Diapherotrites archaeon]